MQAAEQITIAQFLTYADTETTYRLRGAVCNITSTYYGNFTLRDATGCSIAVYGTLNAAGQAYQFASLGVQEGDTITLEGVYFLYNGVTPEIVNAQYISHEHPAEVWVPVPVSISDFIALNDGRRYILTGVVTNIASATYGNLTIEDETGSIYVYGLTDANGTYRSFSGLGIQEGDTVTMTGVYQFYLNTTPEVTSARYISHRHPQSGPTLSTVDFDRDFAQGWDPWIGHTLTFTNDFYLCNVSGNVIAPHRLRSPEEYGDQGTTAYEEALTANTHDSCVVAGLNFAAGCRPGTIIRGLTATVTEAHNLQAVQAEEIIYNELPTAVPDLGNYDVKICGANIENFFVTLGGYAGAADEEQLEVQKTKISTALYHIDADIYAICEMEQGPAAAPVMVGLLNELAGRNVYDWIDAGFSYYDAIMVCFIYRTDKVTPYGPYRMPYTSTYSAYHFREAVQCFRHTATGELFHIALNHFKAKSGASDNTDGTRQTNMTYLINALPTAAAVDPDILVLGDLNAYTGEESNLLLSRDEGYVDLLMKYAPDEYSYVYNNQVGYLDHAYCSPTLESRVTMARPYHLNADTYYRYEYRYGDTSMYRYADHDPILVALRLGNVTTGIESVPSAGSVSVSSSDASSVSPADASSVSPADAPCTKVLDGSRLVLIRGGLRYTITGQCLYPRFDR